MTLLSIYDSLIGVDASDHRNLDGKSSLLISAFTLSITFLRILNLSKWYRNMRSVNEFACYHYRYSIVYRSPVRHDFF